MSPTLNTERCEHCGKAKRLMLTVDPPRGSDRSPLRLCSTCYLEGIRPMDYVGPASPPPPVEIVEPQEPATGRKAKKAPKTRKAG